MKITKILALILFVNILSVNIVFSAIKPQPSKAVIKKELTYPLFSVGTKVLFMFPGISSELWITENFGAGATIWYYGVGNSGFSAYQGALLIKAKVGNIQPAFSLGYVNSQSWGAGEGSGAGEGMFAIGLGLKFDNENISFTPSLEYLIKTGSTVTVPVINFHWYI